MHFEPMMRCLGRGGAVAIVLAATALSAGCGKAIVGEPLTDELGGTSVDARMEFWHTLAERSVVSNDEAFHAVLLYLPDAEPAESYAARVAQLRELGLLHDGFSAKAEQAITRGDLAVIIANHLGIEGGLTMRVFGPSPRYATRELMYRGIYPTSSSNQTWNGNEFVAMIGRIEDYERAEAVKGRPIEAGTEAETAG